jgi:hypothetical protein
MTFSSWKRWPDRNEYYGISFPGVYVVAISDEDLSGLIKKRGRYPFIVNVMWKTLP